MKAILSGISKFIAFVLGGALIFALPLSLILYNAGSFTFQPERITQVAKTIVVESELLPAALEIVTNAQAEEISQKIEDADQQEGLNLFYLIYSMEVRNWMQFQEALLPEALLENWIESSVKGFYFWLDTDQEYPQMAWNLVPVIDQMQGPRGRDAVVAFYESLPDCSDLQMEEMKTNPGDPIPRVRMVEELCKLSTYPHQEQIDVYMDVLQMVIDATPEEYNAAGPVLETGENLQAPFTLKWQLRRLRLNTALIPLLPLSLMFLILVFGVRSISGLGQWWGIPLIGGSLISFVTGLLYRPLWTGILSERMPDAIPPTSELYHQIIDNSALLIGQIFNPLRWQSFLILLIGLGLLVMGLMIRVRGEE